MVFTDYQAVDNCKNIEQSYGEICVHCNRCGRFNVKKVPKECYEEFGKDLDSCSTQENEGCRRCSLFK